MKRFVSLRFALFVFILANVLSIVKPVNEDGINSEQKFTKNPDEQLFKKLFKKRRSEQIQAIKGMLTLKSYEKQYKMVNVIVDKLFNVIQNSRVLLENSGYIPGFSMFPKNETLLDALANILENTALFGDIILRLPDISHKVLNSNNEWRVMYEWSLNFATQTHFLDSSTQTMIDLVSMELNITERHPDYVNPYNKGKKLQNAGYAEPETKKRDKKKKEQRRGPRLHTEL